MHLPFASSPRATCQRWVPIKVPCWAWGIKLLCPAQCHTKPLFFTTAANIGGVLLDQIHLSRGYIKHPRWGQKLSVAHLSSAGEQGLTSGFCLNLKWITSLVPPVSSCAIGVGTTKDAPGARSISRRGL